MGCFANSTIKYTGKNIIAPRMFLAASDNEDLTKIQSRGTILGSKL